MRVLLIEDDLFMAKTIESTFKAEGFSCYIANFGEKGLDLGSVYGYDLIVLDLLLPDMDGFDVLKRFRSSYIQTPILLLSGLNDIADKIKGLECGADDYLTKPFNKLELLARAHAITRRCREYSKLIITTGRLTINLQKREVNVDNILLNLTSKEYSILELLCLKKGTILPKEMFLDHLYGGAVNEPDPKIIDVFVCKLRRKILKASENESYIETIWGQGYVLRDPVKPSSFLLRKNT